MAEGIDVRVGNDGRKSYRVRVWSQRDRKRIVKTFGSLAEAKSWRADALVALDKGALRPRRKTTVREAWDTWYEGAKAGTIRNRSGDPFKPSALRSYEVAMRRRVLPEMGSVKLCDLRRSDLQGFADGLLASGRARPRFRWSLLPLRAIFRRALARGELAVNPCAGLQLPAVRGRRERYASPREADALVAAVPQGDRAIWATAMYAGLRLGELRALRVEDVDLASGVVRVEYGWDSREGRIELKSHAGRRRVPIAAVLRDYLVEHLIRSGRHGSQLIFGRTAESPFAANPLQARADRAWSEAGLDRLTLHNGRHTFASLMIAAGVNAKALQAFMGHATITITMDRYGHLMPGSEAQAADLLDSYLAGERERAEERARAAEPVDQSWTNEGAIQRPEATLCDH